MNKILFLAFRLSKEIKFPIFLEKVKQGEYTEEIEKAKEKLSG